MDLKDNLQSTLGSGYSLESELGGGGMSRVFVAEERALARKVVVKVLPHELAGAVNVERFKREIQLAAGLQHACIVPVLSAGVAGEVPYYTMPFVAGKSLRTRMDESERLTQSEVLRLLRDVASALDHAHAAGIVHRDIKPDNVLLSGGYAVVTDFGVAKALSASAASGEQGVALTGVGVAMGTPAYMAPEQAAAEQVDHRVDIYALGVMAYELLAGTTPFRHRSAAAMLAAHLTETPVTLSHLRPDIARELSDLVMRCMAKEPEDRPQTAGEVVAALEDIASNASGSSVATAKPVTAARALGLWALAAIVEVALARLAVQYVGLPDWVFSGAILLALLAMPLVAATALAHGAQRGSTASRENRAVNRRSILTWRRTLVASGAALAFFAIGVAAYMSMRALGIGPAGSLLAKGVLADRDRIIVADFDVAAQDTTLGSIVTEAFRTDLAQSRAVQVVPPSAVRQTLTLMRRPTDARIDLPLAREIAARDGIKAVVDGEVRQIGGSYLLTARLVQASTGDPIDSFRETAASAGELIAAIEQLSRKLRTRIGESIRGIRTEPALAQVTTQSLPALRSYVDGARLADEGDFAGAVKQLEEAIRLDSGFAMAYRKLAVIMNNNGLNPQRADTMALRAYQLRERLPEREKYLAEAYYHTTRLGYDADKATSAYRALLDIDSLNPIGLNNLSLILMKQREYAAAESLLTRAVALNDGSPSALYNLVVVQFNQGKIDEASRSLARARQLAPRAGTADMMHVNMLTASLQFDAARRALDSLATRKNDIRFRIFNQQLNVILDQVRGRISSSERSQSALVALQREAAGVDARLSAELDFALNDVWFREDTARAIARAERALRATPMTSVPLIERPYVTLGLLYAISGRPDRARAVMNEMLSAFGTSVPQEIVDASRSFLQYGILLAEGRGREAAAVIRSMPADQMCYVCVISFAGYAFDRAGMTDSARVQFERYLETPSMERAGQDARFLAGIYKRLGEFSEERGDKAGALSNYRRFVELWKDADPELQPRVKAVRDRVAALQKLVPA